MKSPFKFLSAYEKEDRDIFFGRDTEILQLHQLVLQSRLTLLYGASGTGKSSLIRCGLANQFQTHDWKEIFIRRKNNLNDSMWAELQKSAITPFQDLDGNGTISLAEAIESLFLDYFTPIYLIFDQFEELFILGTEKEQNEFMQSIAELTERTQNCNVIFSIREEYLGVLYPFEKVISSLLQSRLRVELMSGENLRKVIRNTCEKHQIGIDKPSTIDQILRNIGGKKTGSVSLPYLQVYLDKLYRKAFEEGKKMVFTEKLVSETGEIQDVLDDFLGEQIQAADQKFEEKDLCRKILNEFLTVEGTKRPCEWDEIRHFCKDLVDAKRLQTILLHLVSVRVLQGEENRYELAHDSLAAAIDRRRTAEEKAVLEIRKLLADALSQYQRSQSLLSAESLNYIRKNQVFAKISLSPEEKALLEKSEAKIRRTKRIRNAVIVALSLLTVFAVGFGFFAIEQRNEAEKAKTEADRATEKANKALKEALTSELKRNEGVLVRKKDDLDSFGDTLLQKQTRQEIDSLEKLILNLGQKISEIK